jgi:excinuclease ABC subunit C
MKNDRAAQTIAGPDVELYPHLKITAEDFARVLATRRVEDDGAEYYGAFLTKTSVRLLIDFLNRTFRLRSCDIPIDGSFPVPCTQFYRRRCIAPCVESLCDRESYLRMVELVRLFLANDRAALIDELNVRIEQAAENLDFETAASLRDILNAVEEYWQNARYQVWLDDAVDTYAAEVTNDNVFVHLVTQRGRRVLGRKVFAFDAGAEPGEAIEKVIRTFYRFHLPKEIRVYQDLENRRLITEELCERFEKKAQVVVVRAPDRRLSTTMALYKSRDERELDAAKPHASAWEIERELQAMFGLEHAPGRVEAFDVAHISGSGFVGASSVWIDGHFVGSEYRFHLSEQTSELGAMKETVSLRLSDSERPTPELIIADGGKPQLSAAIEAVNSLSITNVAVASAVKPRGKHSEISHFLDEHGDRIDFNTSSPAHRILKLLRDDAHELSNRVHRDLRDMAHYYELAAIVPSLDEAGRRTLLATTGSIKNILDLDEQNLTRMFEPSTSRAILSDIRNYKNGRSEPVLPLIVPIRFDAEKGDAEDLRPILY